VHQPERALADLPDHAVQIIARGGRHGRRPAPSRPSLVVVDNALFFQRERSVPFSMKSEIFVKTRSD
jgi:hypothetical protein